MKTELLTFTFALALFLSSCQKEVSFEGLSTEIDSIETRSLTLGTWDESGKPNYLLAKDPISPNLDTYIDNTLPERTDLRTSHPELLATNAIADIAITQSSDVYITYVSQGAGTTNAIAFYTYPTNKPLASAKDIKNITYIFSQCWFWHNLRTRRQS